MQNVHLVIVYGLSASERELKITAEEVIILEQSERARDSPTEGLLHLMANKRCTMSELFIYLKNANLLSAMEIIKGYGGLLHIWLVKLVVQSFIIAYAK